MQQNAYELLYYIYILLFGVYASLRLSCGAMAARHWRVFCGASPLLLLLQGVCLQIWDMDVVRLLYPFITHLPVFLALLLVLKIKWNAALTSVIISYALCQLPRWVGLAIYGVKLAPGASFLIHLALSQLLVWLLDKYCLDSIHSAVCGMNHPLLRIGALPALYYLYEYFMVFTAYRFSTVLALGELLPTGLVLFFVLFVVSYQREAEKRMQAERQFSATEMKLSQAEQEITVLRVVQEQTAIYRHDLHHHLMMIDSLIKEDRKEQAESYIHDAVREIQAIVPVRYCENETVNLLLRAFGARAGEMGAELAVKACLPEELDLPDTELCALLSNGLENALNAVGLLPDGADRRVQIYCDIRQSKLLFEIRNPYAGEVVLQDGLPLAKNGERHWGCRSIQSIVQRRRGVCTFEANRGVFVLRIAIPVNPDEGGPK